MIIFTTEKITAGIEHIKYIYHDDDGDWQCLPDREVSMEEAMVVSKEQIISRDQSTAAVFLSLEKGAGVEKKGSVWAKKT